ncbi:phosphoglycerate kinase [Saprospira sp. CCB-QB6]|uniref:phosphoglycerate kinase n=1 Tax=Saprospira sp. CCB-QB6 TaxID=3023936 RepID=UPI00234ABF55|nr:phosphoglycerate kinase [Saprospira sp. CCB-QB6]WCL81264.1 phosphoglycerate kinase [Saprospira sp. CCB-QB6]
MKLSDLSLSDKRILVRLDLNCPLDGEQNITDDSRIRAALPTIKYLMKEGGRLILCSHLGRPQKKLLPNGDIDRQRFSLAPIAQRLSELLDQDVFFQQDCIGPEVQAAAANLQNGQILLLENTRFYKEEKKGDKTFAAELAALADIYVNDAFGAAHRAHASTAVVADFFLPEAKAIGFLMQKEIEQANKLLKEPKRPYLAIVGGAKVSDKILLLEKLMEKVDVLLIGGGMAYTLLKAQGAEIGASLVEEDKLDVAKNFLEKAAQKGVKVLLPEDSYIANEFSATAEKKLADNQNIPAGWMGLDIGPKAQAAFISEIKQAASILWNGPMGVFEFSAFAEGTENVGQALVEATAQGAFSLVGGGDSVAALKKLGKAEAVSHLSTGGGATLEYLQGNELPGLKAIEQ